jgi:hypothetical protein
VRLNGTQLRIQVTIPTQHQPRVTGPIQLTIQSPTSVQRELLTTDGGFNGYGEVVFFRDRAGSPKAARFPVQLLVSPSNGASVRAEGTAEQIQAGLTMTSSR